MVQTWGRGKGGSAIRGNRGRNKQGREFGTLTGMGKRVVHCENDGTDTGERVAQAPGRGGMGEMMVQTWGRG